MLKSNLVGMVQELSGISFIVSAEDDGGSSHGSCGFAGKVRSRVAWINSVSCS